MHLTSYLNIKLKLTLALSWNKCAKICRRRIASSCLILVRPCVCSCDCTSRLHVYCAIHNERL